MTTTQPTPAGCRHAQLARWMRRAGHNCRSLEAATGIRVRTLRAWLQLYRRPSWAACLRVAPALGLKPLTLYKATHDHDPRPNP